MDISILDYAQMDEGESATQALQHTVRLAQLAERLGYKRFWMAEHHNVPAFASSSPALIALQVASQTQHIRIGSGGVMLPHYSPLQVAENFRVLEAYYPGRVDLGMGNNPGTTLVRNAMQDPTPQKQSYLDKMATLQNYLQTDQTDRLEETGVSANPVVSESPEMWMLSTSVQHAIDCAKMGMSYCYGLFPYAREDGIEVGREAVAAYQKHFKPSASQQEPRTMAAIFVSVAKNQALANGMSRALDWWLLGQDDFSYFKRFPSIETGESYVYTPEQEEQAQRNRTRMAHGTIEEVKAQLTALVDTMKVDELLLMPLMPGIDRRIEALELLAEAFHLGEH
ncbi:MAG: LLM class flavin-dependent oxidoreductase [Aerococcus sp.]|nr:LLM class flavin-dependent oxidoreductase [Aerococcus sp.]